MKGWTLVSAPNGAAFEPIFRWYATSLLSVKWFWCPQTLRQISRRV